MKIDQKIYPLTHQLLIDIEEGCEGFKEEKCHLRREKCKNCLIYKYIYKKNPLRREDSIN